MCGVEFEAYIPHDSGSSIHISDMDRFVQRYIKLLEEPHVLLVREKVEPVVDVYVAVSGVFQRRMERKNDIRACFCVYLLAVNTENSRSFHYEQQSVARTVWTVYCESFVMYMMISYAQTFHFHHLYIDFIIIMVEKSTKILHLCYYRSTNTHLLFQQSAIE